VPSHERLLKWFSFFLPLQAVLRLCQGPNRQEHHAALASADALVPLVMFSLSQGETAVKELAARVLCHLSYASVQNQESINEAGAIPALLQLLAQPARTGSRLLEEAAMALKHLCDRHPPIQKAAAQAGAVPVLVQLLEQASSRVQSAGAAALRALCHRHGANQQLLADSGTVPLLVRMLGEQPLALLDLLWLVIINVTNAVRALGASRACLQQRHACACGGPCWSAQQVFGIAYQRRAFVPAALAGGDSAACQEAAADALGTLCAGPPGAAAVGQLAELGGIAALEQLYRAADDPGVSKAAARALKLSLPGAPLPSRDDGERWLLPCAPSAAACICPELRRRRLASIVACRAYPHTQQLAACHACPLTAARHCRTQVLRRPSLAAATRPLGAGRAACSRAPGRRWQTGGAAMSQELWATLGRARTGCAAPGAAAALLLPRQHSRARLSAAARLLWPLFRPRAAPTHPAASSASTWRPPARPAQASAPLPPQPPRQLALGTWRRRTAGPAGPRQAPARWEWQPPRPSAPGTLHPAALSAAASGRRQAAACCPAAASGPRASAACRPPAALPSQVRACAELAVAVHCPEAAWTIHDVHSDAPLIACLFLHRRGNGLGGANAELVLTHACLPVFAGSADMLRDLLGSSTSTPGRRLLPATAPPVCVGRQQGGGKEAQYSANDGMWEAGAVGVDVTAGGKLLGQLAAPTAGPADDGSTQDDPSSDEEPAAVSDSPVAQRPRDSSSLIVTARQLGVPDLQEMRPTASSSLCVTARQAGNPLELGTARAALLRSDGQQAEGRAAARGGGAAGGGADDAVPARSERAPPAAPAPGSGAPQAAKRRGRRVHPMCLCPAVANE
jgi:hypothetical protein